MYVDIGSINENIQVEIRNIDFLYVLTVLSEVNFKRSIKGPLEF